MGLGQIQDCCSVASKHLRIWNGSQATYNDLTGSVWLQQRSHTGCECRLSFRDRKVVVGWALVNAAHHVSELRIGSSKH